MDDMQLKVVTLFTQTLNGAQDAAEVLGLVTQGRDVEDAFLPDVHVILHQALHVIPREVCGKAGIYARRLRHFKHIRIH